MQAKQQAELRRMHASGDYSIADLAELFTVSALGPQWNRFGR